VPASAPFPSAPTGGRLVGRAEIGFDSFQEQYSIVDRDTIDSINEWRARLRLGYARGSFLRNYFTIEGRALIGEGNAETAARVRFTRQLRNNIRSRFSIEGDLSRRTFDETSTFQFPNDFTRAYLNTYLRLAMGSSWAFRASDRLEHLDFENRTEFDYDYTRNAFTLTTQYDWDFSTFINVGIRHTNMSIPDSSEIEYEAWTPVFEIRSAPELRRQIYLQSAVERRLYGDNATRSSYWATLALLNVEWLFTNPFGIILEDNFEYYNFDVSTNAYFNYIENRMILLASLYPSWYSRFGVGPSWGFLRSDLSPGDEYTELGVVVRWEYNRSARFWIQMQYEPGRRVYPAFDPNATFDFESIFSDYTYHRFSMFLNWRIWKGAGINAFVDYQPEDHEREGDDATAALFSISLSYAF